MGYTVVYRGMGVNPIHGTVATVLSHLQPRSPIRASILAGIEAVVQRKAAIMSRVPPPPLVRAVLNPIPIVQLHAMVGAISVRDVRKRVEYALLFLVVTALWGLVLYVGMSSL
jgi:hypothetical protein